MMSISGRPPIRMERSKKGVSTFLIEVQPHHLPAFNGHRAEKEENPCWRNRERSRLEIVVMCNVGTYIYGGVWNARNISPP